MTRHGHGLPILARSRGNGGPRPTLATVVTGSGAPAPAAVAAHNPEQDRPAELLLPQACGVGGCRRPGRILWMQAWWCLGCVSAVLVRTTRGAA